MQVNRHLIINYKKLVRDKGKKIFYETPLAKTGLDSKNLTTDFLCKLIYLMPNDLNFITSLDNFFYNKNIENVKIVSNDVISKELEDNIKSSFLIIEEIWPEYKTLINDILEKIVIVESNSEFESWSDPKRFGSIFFKRTRIDVVSILEIVVHEVAHLYLYGVTSQTKFKQVKNYEQKYFSKIRNTERPLIGVFHGLFVEMAEINLSYRLKNSKYYNIFKDRIDKLERDFTLRFKKDYAALENHELLKIDSLIYNNLCSTFDMVTTNE